MKKSIIPIFLAIYIFSLFQTFAFANDTKTIVQNDILSAEIQYFNSGQADNKLVLALELNFKDNRYTYAPNYSTFPTRLYIENAEYSVSYIKAEKSYDPLTKENLELYKENIKYFFVFDSYNSQNLKLDISLLLCTKENCMAYSETIPLILPMKPEALESIVQSNINNDFTNALTIKDESYYKKKSSISFGLSASSQNLSSTNSHTNDDIDIFDLSSISSNLTTKEQFNFTPQAFNTSLEVKSFGLALIFGLLAGFILNLMPCVLPVVAIKITSLMQSSSDEENQYEIIRTHSIFFGLGVLSLFALLAIFVGFFDMIWGELFQNIFFLVILTNLIFMFGLSLAGLFSFPFFNIRQSSSKSPRIQAYTQGFIATIIATPCSGPLLGGVLAFSLTLPLHLIILVFLATGLGMALPYFMLAMFPRFVRYIPKPGKWTGLLEKILAFMFFLTAIYLLSLIPSDMVLKVILSLFMLSLLLFIYSNVAYKKYVYKISALLISIYLVTFYLLFVKVDNSKMLEWENYSYQILEENLTKEALLVTFTADWCPTCKVLESTVLNYENIQPLADKYDLKLIKVDLTKPDNSSENFLKSLDSASIPLLAFFPKGIFAHSPIILRDIYTLEQIETILAEHF